MLVDTLEKTKELEDRAIGDYLQKHSAYLKKIEYYEQYLEEGNALGQVEYAKMEYWYSKCQVYAYLIASFYRKQQRYYEAKAEQAQADSYEFVRLGNYHEKLKTSTDAQYISRNAKGVQLEIASSHEGNRDRWNGIALAYGNAINSIKDMYKGDKAEQTGKQFS